MAVTVGIKEPYHAEFGEVVRMSVDIKIEFISEGFRQILLSEGTKSVVTSAAEKIQAEANSGLTNSQGFSANTWVGGYGGGRYVASVTSIDRAAAAAEAENQVLTRAVHA